MAVGQRRCGGPGEYPWYEAMDVRNLKTVPGTHPGWGVAVTILPSSETVTTTATAGETCAKHVKKSMYLGQTSSNFTFPLSRRRGRQ